MSSERATGHETAILASAAASTLYLLPYGADRGVEGRRLVASLLGRSERDVSLAERGVHPDVIELAPPEGKERIGIDQVRAVIRSAQFAPVEADRKVCLIAQAEALTPEAGNALLKVMEEPPRDLAFVLLAEHPSDLLPTIVSRSRLVRVPPPDSGARKAELERTGYTQEEAVRILRIASTAEDLDVFMASRIDLTRSLEDAAETLGAGTIVALVEAAVGDDPVRRAEAQLLLLSKAATQDGELLTVGVRALAVQDRETVARLLRDLLGLAFDLLSSFHTGVLLAPRWLEMRDRIGERRLHGLCADMETAHQALRVYGPIEGILLALFLPEGDEDDG